jgi:hypothetical protein
MSNFFIFDTNSLISASLIIDSVSARALDRVFKTGNLIFSEETFSEFINVLYRPKLDKYLSEERRSQIIDRMEHKSRRFPSGKPIKYCRDPKDNMFLSLAISAKATCIVSGDKDLLVLNPFCGIPIITASEFIESNF